MNWREGSRNMTPRAPDTGTSHSILANVEFRCDCSDAHPLLSQISSISHGRFSQLRNSIVGTLWTVSSTLCDRIKLIIAIATEKEMRRANARWIIASMANIKMLRWLHPVCQFIRNPVNLQGQSNDANGSIPPIIFSTRPPNTGKGIPRQQRIIMYVRYQLSQQIVIANLVLHPSARLWLLMSAHIAVARRRGFCILPQTVKW